MNRFFSGVMLLTGILFLVPYIVNAQKKLVNDTTYRQWSSLDNDYKLSDDGKYVSYDVRGYGWDNSYGFLLTSKGEELMKISGRIRTEFTADSRYLISVLHGDSIIVIDIAKRKIKSVCRGAEFQLLKNGKRNWLVGLAKDTATVLNLETGAAVQFTDVKQIKPVAGNTAVVLRKGTELLWMDPVSNKARSIFRGEISRLTASGDGSRIAFMHSSKEERKIWYFNSSMSEPALMVFNDMPELHGRIVASEQELRFTPNGKRLLFCLEKKYTPPAKDADFLTSEVELWHYRDAELFSARKYFNPSTITYKAVVSLDPQVKNLIILEDDTMAITMSGNEYALLKRTYGRDEEAYYNTEKPIFYTLVSLKDGSAKSVLPSTVQIWYPFLSDAEKFIIWSDKKNEDYFSYEIATGITRNITAGLNLVPDMPLINYGSPVWKLQILLQSWNHNDELLLMKDRYDCWLIDPLGVKAPVNITNGYGRRNKISFDPAINTPHGRLPDGRLILRARNERTGDNGFFEVKFPSDPAQLIMEPAMYSWHKVGEPPRLRKAKNANVFIVTKQTAASSPNILVSSDLKNFRQLSNIQPEKDFNWMQSELLLFPKKDGDTGQAILYKPDDFDASKKYPVIFHFYQTRNEELHDYRKAAVDPNSIDIPWYVSNGYLVCIPDINHYRPGRIAETVTNSVEGAARYLSRFSWIDSTKFGAQGHSFGGYETLLLISHSKMFAAAQASAAVSDLVSAIGGVAFGDHELYTFHEVGQPNMGIGNLPWSNTQSYIDNSPVFHADKITTPLLLMHGYLDENVKFSQDIEMFTALRRLQKPVWILGYKDGHIISDYDEKGRDAALRQKQFFEHYLKGKPAPVWMTKGIRPEERNFKSGLQLDTTGAKP